MMGIVSIIQSSKYPTKILLYFLLGTLFPMFLIGIMAKDTSSAFLAWFVFVVGPFMIGFGLMRILFPDIWHSSD